MNNSGAVSYGGILILILIYDYCGIKYLGSYIETLIIKSVKAGLKSLKRSHILKAYEVYSNILVLTISYS